jgi:hypothetical protein
LLLLVVLLLLLYLLLLSLLLLLLAICLSEMVPISFAFGAGSVWHEL